MKLFLTSGGFQDFGTGMIRQDLADEFLRAVSLQKNKTVCLIHTIRTGDDWKWIDLYDRELRALDIPYVTLNISEEKDLSNVSGYGAYYVCGGNTFYILDRFRKTYLDRAILREVEMGKIYIGVSAGSIMASSTIEAASIGEMPDENDVHLSDLQGFGWVPFHIIPHYTDRERSYVESFFKKKGESIIALTDEQMVFVDGNESKIIGKSGGVSFGKDVPLYVS